LATLIGFVVSLPRQSALARAQGLWWSESHELAATGVELAHEHLRVAMAAAGVRKSRLPKPLRVPRPRPVMRADGRSGATPSPSTPRRPATSVADVVAVLEASHRRVGS
jgi:hypothetical protein